MISKKTVRFIQWLNRTGNGLVTGEELKLLTELEIASRLLVHDFDQQGEVSQKNLIALARASKKLQEAYGKD